MHEGVPRKQTSFFFNQFAQPLCKVWSYAYKLDILHIYTINYYINKRVSRKDTSFFSKLSQIPTDGLSLREPGQPSTSSGARA